MAICIKFRLRRNNERQKSASWFEKNAKKDFPSEETFRHSDIQTFRHSDIQTGDGRVETGVGS
ncbi:hypothetical protein IMPR6_140091 [Imperialibacter sp. EC-SDR9]|nr:hypothetical protein IMPERIA89_170082 [Imperialibacter sp. 89]CAD5260914.1 hypothetical protein IMPERIA75_260082 [Imperialibacter sp. 75]VVT03864.1 hypothetical protein IMPR6_140091 [Imperialibacter sp. EC-SDR9]